MFHPTKLWLWLSFRLGRNILRLDRMCSTSVALKGEGFRDTSLTTRHSEPLGRQAFSAAIKGLLGA